MKIYTSFKFITPKKQIEEEILNLKKCWEEHLEEDKRWNKEYEKYGEKKELFQAYGILVSIKIYNAIREIYHCNIPYPHDTKKLYGLEIGILKRNREAQIMIVDKKKFKKEQEKK